MHHNTSVQPKCHSRVSLKSIQRKIKSLYSRLFQLTFENSLIFFLGIAAHPQHLVLRESHSPSFFFCWGHADFIMIVPTLNRIFIPGGWIWNMKPNFNIIAFNNYHHHNKSWGKFYFGCLECLQPSLIYFTSLISFKNCHQLSKQNNLQPSRLQEIHWKHDKECRVNAVLNELTI